MSRVKSEEGIGKLGAGGDWQGHHRRLCNVLTYKLYQQAFGNELTKHSYLLYILDQ